MIEDYVGKMVYLFNYGCYGQVVGAADGLLHVDISASWGRPKIVTAGLDEVRS